MDPKIKNYRDVEGWPKYEVHSVLLKQNQDHIASDLEKLNEMFPSNPDEVLVEYHLQFRKLVYNGKMWENATILSRRAAEKDLKAYLE